MGEVEGPGVTPEMKIGTVPAVRIEKHQVPHPGYEFMSPYSP